MSPRDVENGTSAPSLRWTRPGGLHLTRKRPWRSTCCSSTTGARPHRTTTCRWTSGRQTRSPRTCSSCTTSPPARGDRRVRRRTGAVARGHLGPLRRHRPSAGHRGPFAETKDLIAGWMTIDVDCHERALELAAELSAAPGAGGEPIHEWPRPPVPRRASDGHGVTRGGQGPAAESHPSVIGISSAAELTSRRPRTPSRTPWSGRARVAGRPAARPQGVDGHLASRRLLDAPAPTPPGAGASCSSRRSRRRNPGAATRRHPRAVLPVRPPRPCHRRRRSRSPCARSPA